MNGTQVLLVALLALILGGIWLALRRHESASVKSVGRMCGLASCAVVFVGLIMYPFILGALIVTSRSMEPTLDVGDQVFINKFIYRFRQPHYGEIVLFQAPDEIADKSGEDDYVKRVVGLPGDVMEVRPSTVDGLGQIRSALYRNGTQIKEPYLAEPMTYFMRPVKVPPGKVFVLGDNRNESFDSHRWGPLDENRLIGMATLRFRPTSRFGYVR